MTEAGRDVKFLTMTELEAGLDEIRRSPRDAGVLNLIVRRPAVGRRELLDEAQLDEIEGLIGDNWSTRGSSRTADGSAHPDMQINVMNSRVISLVAGARDRWHLAGDQLFFDMDLSEENLPAGTGLWVGEAIIVVTDQPHTGCRKFVERFGADAMKFVNSSIGRELHLRGINARVLRPGIIRVGDVVTKLPINGPSSAHAVPDA